MTYKNPPYHEPKHPVGTVAELFAGVGGFRVGLARAGWKTVYSNQWEPATKVQHASDVYVANFGPEGHSNEDIATVKKVPVDFDLLVGGFPCQDYSVAKSAKSATGLEGKKGVLWWEILRLVMMHKPKYLFLENVDRLLKSPTSQRGRDFAVMLSTLGNAGYAVEWRVVNAAEYGFPQRRIRVLLVATRKSGLSRKQDPAEQIYHEGVLAQALRVEANDAGILEIPIAQNPELVSREFGKSERYSPFSTGGFYVDGTAWTAKVVSDSRLKRTTLGEVLENDADVPKEFWVPLNRFPEWEFLKGAKAVERVHKESGFVYKYSEGSMAFPDHLDRPSRTILTGEGGQTPSRFKHIIRTGGGYRRLLPVELERLSGFPDGWTNPPSLGGMTDARRAFFIGNALVTGLVEMVGRQLALRIS
ncbi:MAG: DNA cytosine methyltransferase [Pontimonas sp.]|nr:DNA cytosine methyltransferase [Pontimonas sp.]